MWEFQNISDRCTSETVQALIVVTDNTNILMLSTEQEYELLQNVVRILILVDHDVVDFCSEFGKYIPARKTSAGKFTMPLFAARAPADSVLGDAARYRYLRDGDWREHEKLESVIRLQLNALWDETIDAARKEGGV